MRLCVHRRNVTRMSICAQMANALIRCRSVPGSRRAALVQRMTSSDAAVELTSVLDIHAVKTKSVLTNPLASNASADVAISLAVMAERALISMNVKSTFAASCATTRLAATVANVPQTTD